MMALPRLDPRVNTDRIYHYEDYRVLSTSFPQRKKLKWYERLLGRKTRCTVRLLEYKIGLALGMLVIMGAVTAGAFLDADTARLSYAKQDYQAKLLGLDQATTEARGAQLSQEQAVLSGQEVSSAEVVYPVSARYLILTNIPEAGGRRLVEELYPLSASIIEVSR